MKRCLISFICLLLLGIQAFVLEDVCVSRPLEAETPEASEGLQAGKQSLPSSGLTIYRIYDAESSPEDKIIETQLPDSREWTPLKEGEDIPEGAVIYTGQGATALRDKKDNFYKIPSYTKIDVGKDQHLRYKVDKKELESDSP
jgi:hypothetical protein